MLKVNQPLTVERASLLLATFHKLLHWQDNIVHKLKKKTNLP